MTENCDNAAAPQTIERGPPPSLTLPLLLWLALQMVPLLLAARRVPLATGTAGYPPPAEQLAAHLMVAFQMAGSALLFPLVLRTWPVAFAVVCASWPFQWLSGYLAAQPALALLPASLYVSLWLLALAMWQVALRTPDLRQLGTAVATAVCVGGAAVWYLAAEFGPPPSPTALPRPAWFGPLAGALALLPSADSSATEPPLSPTVFPWAVWLWPAIFFPGGVVAAWLARRRGVQALATGQSSAG